MKQKYKEYEKLIGMENLTMLSHVFGGSNIYSNTTLKKEIIFY